MELCPGEHIGIRLPGRAEKILKQNGIVVYKTMISSSIISYKKKCPHSRQVRKGPCGSSLRGFKLSQWRFCIGTVTSPAWWNFMSPTGYIGRIIKIREGD